jgi:hypothetical protein
MLIIIPNPIRGRDNWVAHPRFPVWNGMKCKTRKAVKNGLMNAPRQESLWL